MIIATVHGNTGGLKSGLLRGLERLYRRRCPPEALVTNDLAREMARLAAACNRQVGVLIDRGGSVELVLVGDHKSILIPVLPQVRSGRGRLKGLRCIHIHLAGEPLTQDDLTDLLFLRLDCMAAITVDAEGLPRQVHAAHLVPSSLAIDKPAPEDGGPAAKPAGKPWRLIEPQHPAEIQRRVDFRELVAALEGEFARLRPLAEVDKGRDRAILISVTTASKRLAQESMDELVELARSDDVVVLDTVIQQRRRIHPRWIMGKGKLGEIMLRALVLNANLLIFDQELNPSQIRSITDHTELRVIDRTQLILDIFARRARSREGRLQIEMAQLKYMLPRLTLRDDALSRLTGGIGGRGPGETKLEIDRRRINDRLAKLARRLRQVADERHRRRQRRRKKGLPVLSLVGYTNAGKSTLLNSLTKSDITAEDKLFATLDPTSRRLRFPRDIEVIVTDTVGFIRNLPAELLQAFRATLEELYEADMLVHVIDGASPRCRDQVRVVEELLADMDLDRLPMIRVLNKVDLLGAGQAARLARELEAVPVCALDRATFGPFIERAAALVEEKWRAVSGGGQSAAVLEDRA